MSLLTMIELLAALNMLTEISGEPLRIFTLNEE